MKVQPWGWRHLLYFSLLPFLVHAAGEPAISNGDVKNYAAWLTVAVLTVIAILTGWHLQVNWKDHDLQKDLSGSLKGLAATMKRVEASVGDLARNQSYITTRQTEQETASKAAADLQAEKWRLQEKTCNEHRERCKLCDRRKDKE